MNLSLINRRDFLRTSAGAALALGSSPLAVAETKREKAPFRVLYSNDTTNVTGCVSPFHQAREPFRREMLEASVDEVAGIGVDAHFLQPGLGMVPMWPSKVLPLEEHYAWIKERYGQSPDSFGRFVLGGGDIVQIFVDRCRLRGQAPFISFRLNDAHHKEWTDAKKGEKVGSLGMSVTRFYHDHPEYRIKAGSSRGADVVQNWAMPEVRAQKFALIQELCENYDLEGLELDFLRFYNFFRPEETTRGQRAEIVTGFVRQVRELLDRTSRDGRRRWLCARLPCVAKSFDSLGIHLPQMVAAGLDMVNLSASYFTVQQTDLAKIRAMIPNAAVYLELCHTTWTGEKLQPGYDVIPYRRTTPEQYYTAAHLAYARGADGLSAFNFAYYREHGLAGRGPHGEPPFEIFQHLRDPQWLAKQPQHWFLAQGWNNPWVRPPILPRSLALGGKTGFSLDLAPPPGGWQRGGRLRLQTAEAHDDRRWRVRLNDETLAPSDDVSEPYPVPYPAMLGTRETLRAWQVPANLLRDGVNRFEFMLEAGGEPRLQFLDLAVV